MNAAGSFAELFRKRNQIENVKNWGCHGLRGTVVIKVPVNCRAQQVVVLQLAHLPLESKLDGLEFEGRVRFVEVGAQFLFQFPKV